MIGDINYKNNHINGHIDDSRIEEIDELNQDYRYDECNSFSDCNFSDEYNGDIYKLRYEDRDKEVQDNEYDERDENNNEDEQDDWNNKKDESGNLGTLELVKVQGVNELMKRADSHVANDASSYIEDIEDIDDRLDAALKQLDDVRKKCRELAMIVKPLLEDAIIHQSDSEDNIV